MALIYATGLFNLPKARRGRLERKKPATSLKEREKSLLDGLSFFARKK